MSTVALPPSREALLSLYHCTLRTSQSFTSYNFRHYFVRRTKEAFRKIQKETCPEKVGSLYSQAAKDCTVIHRCVIMDRLYGGWKIALEAEGLDKKA